MKRDLTRNEESSPRGSIQLRLTLDSSLPIKYNTRSMCNNQIQQEKGQQRILSHLEHMVAQRLVLRGGGELLTRWVKMVHFIF